MKNLIRSVHFALPQKLTIAAVVLISIPLAVDATDRKGPPVNKYGAPALDANGHRTNYDQKIIEAMARKAGINKQTNAKGSLADRECSEAARFCAFGRTDAAAVLAIRHLWRWYWG